MKKRIGMAVFLTAELFLYILILTADGDLLVVSSYGAIILCLFYALLHRGQLLLLAGLGFTVLADFCLVVSSPVQRLGGMVFFLGTQLCYAAWLHLQNPNKRLLTVRGTVTAASLLLTVAVLGGKTDALALVSVCYYGNLMVNIAASFLLRRKLLTVGLVLFLLCDTVIGLQVASGGYLPIGEGTALYGLLFSGFNLAWFFYLPSQICIALTASKK